jgi:hypothetical protein
VQPYLGLGAALGRAGHRVTVAAPAAFEGLVRRAGLSAFLVEPDPRLHVANGEPPRWLQSSAFVGAIRLHRATRAGSRLSVAFAGYRQASRKADVILHPAWLAPVARTIAQTDGCLALPTYLTPIHPTRAFPSPFFQLSPHPGWNGLSHVLILWLGRAALDGAPNSWRSHVAGLPPTTIGFLPPSGEPCLYGFSSHLICLLLLDGSPCTIFPSIGSSRE